MTALPSSSDLTPSEHLLSKQVVELLKDSLSLIEEVTPQLSFTCEHLLHQIQNASEEDMRLPILKHMADEWNSQYRQSIHLRFKLHALLFGLGVETHPERFRHGFITAMPSELRPGNLIEALEAMSYPMVFDEEEPDTEADGDLPGESQALDTPLF